MEKQIVVLFFLVIIGTVLGQNTTTNKPPPTSTTTSQTTPGTTLSPKESCKSANKDCNTCLRHDAKCMWCSDGDTETSEKCVPYPVGNILPLHKCKGGLDAARWGVCWVNFKVLLIVMGCLAGVILISLSCCIYCCCCRSGGNKKKYEQEDAKYERQKEERKVKSEERRAERKAKHDEIRRKYGLIKEDNPYQRFDA